MKTKTGISIAFIAFLLLPTLLVFKSFFYPGSLSWGDAPHFYPEGIKELISEPQAWTNRGVSFGGTNNFLFLSPLMFLYGVVGSFLGNDLAIRLIFYFPSVVLAGLGVYFLTRYLKFSGPVQFFSILIYILNTYFLLLIDGGQVGIVLAYGFFPFATLYLKKLIDFPALSTFYLSLIYLSLLSSTDPRIAAISVITVVIWSLLELKTRNLLYLIPLGAAVFGINLYWIFPTFSNGNMVASMAPITNIRWYDPFLLFSPHWPGNLFGQAVRPPLFFAGIPILIFFGLLLDHSRKAVIFAFLFLVFGVLSLGLPLIDKIPYGIAFRDSTKFFIPLILFGGFLVGNSIEEISKKFQKKRFVSSLVFVISYLYLLFLINPALLGKMNFVLSNRQASEDFPKIYEKLKSDPSFFRTVWIPEKPPLAFDTSRNPALDGRDLTKFMPFASINAGEDVFNFYNNQDFVHAAKILGVKYLFLSDNPREISKNEKDTADWQTITGLIDKNNKLTRLDWDTKIPIYKIENPYPRFFAARTLAAVVGSPLPPETLFVPSVYFEDGKWDPRELIGKQPSSLDLVFNGGDKTDLTMSLLQKYFVSGKEAAKNEWAVYSPNQYLKYKYELLIRGIKFNDLDYSKGISFSTQKGEKMEFDFDVPQDGSYIFAYRSMVPSQNEVRLNWKTKIVTFLKGKQTEVIENNSGLEIFNVASLIPKTDFDEATDLADIFIKTFKTVNPKDLSTSEDYQELAMDNLGALKYKFQMPEGFNWVVFSDSYNPLWQLRQGNEYRQSFPIYSMTNGFYAEDKWSNIGIEFRGQENVRWGMYFTVLSFLTLAIIFLYAKQDSRRS